MSDDMITNDPVEGGATRRKLLTGMGVAAGGGLLAIAGSRPAQAAVEDGTYNSFGPLRIYDSRDSDGRIVGGQTRILEDFEGSDFLTFAINLTVTSTSGSGYLALYSADLPLRPNPYSSINWQGAGKTVANFNLIDGGEAGIAVYCSGGSSNRTHFIIDVIGLLVSAAEPPAVVQAWKARAAQRKQSR
jgi:hypothetical protein